MNASKNAKVAEVFSEFEANFGGSLFSEEDLVKIQEVSSRMLDLRMSVNPHFTKYLECLNTIKAIYPSEDKLKEWHLVIDRLLDRVEREDTNNPFFAFLNFSISFYKDKALKYSKGGTSWYALTNIFSLDMIEDDPVVRFEGLDLMCSYGKDSIVIEETRGIFFPLDRTWKGERGKVNWRRHEDLEEEIYVEFPDYSFDMSKGTYEVNNARMYFPLFFGQRLVQGDFQDKVVALSKGAVPAFPQFESYNKKLELDNIGEGVRYTGGIRIKGTTIYGYGSREEKAKLSIADDKGNPLFDGASELFIIKRGKQIFGQDVASSVYINQDSIYHPGVNVQFDIPERIMLLSRERSGVSRNPFFSSYHQVEISADAIEVHYNEDSMVIGKQETPISVKAPVTFESIKYFKRSEYDRFQNISTVNPIAAMKLAADEQGLNFIQAEDLAKKLNPNYKVENIKNLLYDMVSHGFIRYNDNNNEVEILDKVFHYADARQQKVDYDVLSVVSDTLALNASLDFETNEISVDGVKDVEFSRKQMVAVMPQGRKMVIKKNRNLEFGGILYAGLTKMEGDTFNFDYDMFQIAFDSVKYFDFYVPTGEFDTETGRPKAYGINSRVENISGVILIDAPRNKSGRQDIPMFPSLQTTKFSYVYYDKREIQDSVYTRDSFYFRIDPFGIDHLDYFPRKDMNFKGQLFSYDIFPPFADTLRLQDDGSLGLVTRTPKDNFETYTGKGYYTGDIRLNNSGLKGDGNLKYLGASLNAKNIVFRPKQLTAKADTFFLEEDRLSDIQVPQARGVNVDIDWRPYKDSMYISTQGTPFDFYQENDHTLKGLVTLTPGGVKGDGLFRWDRATISSEYFSFGAFSSDADSADIRIFAYSEDGTTSLQDVAAIRTDNISASVDFDEKQGLFKSYDDFVKTELPFNNYETSMNEFDWNMEDEVVSFYSKEGKPGRFLSTDRQRDSLRFNGETARYELKSNLLEVRGVPYVIAADAFIYPDSGKVEIQAGGTMTTLENARIVADTVTKYHVINRATVDISGRRYYSGSGFYEYNVGDKEQEIEFADIIGKPYGYQSVKNNPVFTKAQGKVEEDDEFYIDLKTQYQGEIELSSDTKNLFFDGYARLDADKLPEKYWISIQSEGDKRNLVIKYDRPRSTEGDLLRTGFFLSRETAQIYPRVMMPLYMGRDRELMPVTGYFNYDEDNDSFIFGDSARIYTDDVRGNKLVFDNRSGRVSADGLIDIGAGLKMADVRAGGTIEMDFPPPRQEEVIDPNIMIDPEAVDSTELEEPYPDVELNLMATINIAIPDRLLKIMAIDIASSAYITPNVAYLTDVEYYKKTATQILPKDKDIEEAITFMSSGVFELPKKSNNFTFFITKLPLIWNSEYQSFVNKDEKIGIGSIGGENINKMLEAFIQFNIRSSGDDRLYLYIKSPSGSFFYFGLKQGILDIASDNQAFNNELFKLKKKDLIIKMDDGRTLEIQPVEASSARLFVRRMQVMKDN